MKFYCNGILRDSKFELSPNNQGLKYGYGLFETIKAIDKEILFWEDHFQRLINGAQRLNLMAYGTIDEAQLLDEVASLLEQNNLMNAIVRINIFHGDDQLFRIVETKKDAIAGNYFLNEKGLKLSFDKTIRITPNILTSIKSNNRLPYILAKQNMEESFDEVLILNTKGCIADASIYNVFWIKGDQVFTVPITDGCIEGIMRKQIINNFEVIEQSIKPVDLKKADEIFLTNVVKGIRWVESFEGEKYTNTKTKQILLLLNSLNHL